MYLESAQLHRVYEGERRAGHRPDHPGHVNTWDIFINTKKLHICLRKPGITNLEEIRTQLPSQAPSLTPTAIDRSVLTSREAALLLISTLFAEHLQQVIPGSFPAELGAVPAHGGTGRQAPQS